MRWSSGIALEGNALIDLPKGMEKNRSQLRTQNRILQKKNLIARLRASLQGKHDDHGIAALLDTMERIFGKKIRSKLHACIYEVCKMEKTFCKQVKVLDFGRKAFVDPTMPTKFKIAALEKFEKALLAIK